MKMFLGENHHAVLQAIAVAAISGHPVLLFGPPGVGKSDPAFLAAEAFCGGDRTKVWHRTLGPGTPPSVISGMVDVSGMVNDGVVRYTVTGTPHQDGVRAVIIDEITRANRGAMDSLLPILSSAYKPESATLRIATTNFGFTDPDIFDPPQIEQNRALADRFSHVLILTYEPPQDAADALDAYAARSLLMGNRKAWASMLVPDYQEVEAFRAMIRSMNADHLKMEGTPLNHVIKAALERLDDANRSMRRIVSFTQAVILTHWYDAWKQSSMRDWTASKNDAVSAYMSGNPEAAKAVWQEYARSIVRRISDTAHSIPIGALTQMALQTSVYLDNIRSAQKWSEGVLSLIPGRKIPGDISPSDYAQQVYQTAVRVAVGDARATALLNDEIYTTLKTLEPFIFQSQDARLLYAYTHVCMHAANSGVDGLQGLNVDRWPPSQEMVDRILLLYEQIHPERQDARMKRRK
jgi:MoxR-like ATPase